MAAAMNAAAAEEGSGGGDPYLYPLVGPPIKLPNVEQVYRLYQDTDVVVNARVARASPQIRAEIEALVQDTGLRAVSTEAYFFSTLFIGSRHDPSDHVVVDLEGKTTSGSTATFCVEDILGHRVCTTHVLAGMSLMVSFSRNPQVRNGLRLCGTNLRDGPAFTSL